ncbi:hypothetical protein OROGR_027429 [Orobanche gracilis]
MGRSLAFVVFSAVLTATLLPLGIMAQFECRDEIASLSPCYSYIRGREEEFPSPDCCNRLEDVVQRQPNCLCELLRDDEGIDTTRVSELPSACSVRTTSIDNCNYDGYSTEILNSLLVYLLIFASCAHIFI